MSRVAVGWFSALVATLEAVHITEADDLDDVEGALVASLLGAPAGVPVALDVQGPLTRKQGRGRLSGGSACSCLKFAGQLSWGLHRPHSA